MRTEHLELLVEEPSMEAFLQGFLPRLLADRATFTIHGHQGKKDLLAKLPARLRGYAKWLPNNMRIVVLIDRDNDDCQTLKKSMEQFAKDASFVTRSASRSTDWQVVNRIAVEELEAWFFSEWNAVKLAYPRVQSTIPNQSPYRNSDAIAGGTWEALERQLKNAGYFSTGIRKVELSMAVATYFDGAASNSQSFNIFQQAILEAIA